MTRQDARSHLRAGVADRLDRARKACVPGDGTTKITAHLDRNVAGVTSGACPARP